MKLDNLLPIEKRQFQAANVRINWVDLFEPRVPQNSDSGNARYGVTMMLNTSTHAKLIKQIRKVLGHIAENVLEMELGEIEYSKLPLKKPRKKDIEKQPAYEDHMLLPAYSPAAKPVQVVDGNMKTLLKGSPVPYSGCVCNVAFEFYVSKNQPDAIYCSLNAVQFVEEGDSLGGGQKPKAEDLFKKIAPEDDDFDEDEDEDDDL